MSTSQIINESNLREDFIEGLSNYIDRELTPEEIKLFIDDEIDNLIDKMFETESEIICQLGQRMINLGVDSQKQAIRENMKLISQLYEVSASRRAMGNKDNKDE